MKIEHVAIWVRDLEGMKEFYEKYFHCHANTKYENSIKQFESYFLTFESGTRLEIMCKSGIEKKVLEEIIGWAHIAISLGSREAVNQLTSRLEKDGFALVSNPRFTGDGYYESVVKDPEGNLIELTV